MNVAIALLILIGLTVHRYLSTFWEQGLLPYSPGSLRLASHTSDTRGMWRNTVSLFSLNVSQGRLGYSAVRNLGIPGHVSDALAPL